MESAGRRVCALVVHDSALLGALAPLEVTSPWWADVEPGTAELDRRLGARTAVLCMVATTGRSPRGGEVTDLAEALTPPTANPDRDGAPDPAVLAPHERRMRWAEPGGLDAVLGGRVAGRSTRLGPGPGRGAGAAPSSTSRPRWPTKGSSTASSPTSGPITRAIPGPLDPAPTSFSYADLAVALVDEADAPRHHRALVAIGA